MAGQDELALRVSKVSAETPVGQPEVRLPMSSLILYTALGHQSLCQAWLLVPGFPPSRNLSAKLYEGPDGHHLCFAA